MSAAVRSSVTSATIALLRFVWEHPENEGKRLRAIGRVVLWQLWQRTVKRPLFVSMPGGHRLKCYPHSTAATGVLYCRLPEWEDMRFLIDFLRPGDTFIDVGANVGVYTLLASSVADVNTWAFEPSSSAFERLQENVELNELDSQVVTVQAAVGSSGGRVSVTTGRDTVNRLVLPGEATQSEEVELVTLDAALTTSARASVRLLKIDVEGFEEQVLEGASDLLEEGPAVIVEANDPSGIARVLAPLGYLPYFYEPGSHQLVQTDWLAKRPGNNLLAIRDQELARTRLSASAPK